MTGFDSKRHMAQAKVNDDDDTQVYADMLLIVYQRGFADGKRAAQPEQEPCIGKDPRCPCQDGDACHYKDCGGGTKARPVAQPEQEPVAFAAEIVEDVNGFLSTRWADWWMPNEGDKLYTTPPAAQPEQQAEPVPVAHTHQWFSTGAMEPGQMRCIHCGVWGTTTTNTLP
jgi:hypothetical protein